MKKLTATLLSLLMLIAALGGCRPKDAEESRAPEGGGAEPLRVFIDVEFGSNVFISVREFLRDYEAETTKGGKTKYKSFQTVIAELGGPEDIELEFAPKCGDERDAYMTALRTEIMAGKGPDVFVTLSGYGNHWDDASLSKLCREDSLFQFPKQAMERNMFLPLDDYIEKARFMEWDKLTTIIMETGKNEHGQLLLPMTYTVPVATFKSEDIDFRLDGNTGLTWRDMLSGPPELVVSAAKSHASMQSAALYPIADYKKDELAITEEELLDYVTSRKDAYEQCKEMKFPEGSISCLMPLNWFDDEYGSENQLTMAPLFSRSGGYSAVVTSFIGINVNTNRPDDAFFIVDYLMSKEAQQSKLYTHMTWGNAVPTMEGLLSGRGNGISDGDSKYHYMSENLYSEFGKLRANISGADFYTPLDAEFFELEGELYDGPSKPVEELVHDMYMRMNMMLAES